MALIGLSCFFMARKTMEVGEKDFAPTCERYFTQVATGNYRSAYADFSDEMHTATKEEDYVAFDQGIHELLGNLREKSIVHVMTGIDQKGRWGRIIYQGKFEKGEGTIRFELRKEGTTFKILGLNYESPRLVEAIKAQAPPAP